MLSYLWPVLLIVASNVVYHMVNKLVGAAVCLFGLCLISR